MQALMPRLNPVHAWWVLSLAIVLEVGGTTCMRLCEGFNRLTPSVLIFVFYAASFALNLLVIGVLGLAVAYAVWSGVGTPATALEMASAGPIVMGVMGMHLGSRGAA